jgi:adenylate cyclase
MRSPVVAALAIGLAVALLTIGVQRLGWLERADLALYDQYLSLEPVPAQMDPRVAILAVTEQDIAELGQYPLSDRTIAAALRRLLDDGARVVGIDIHRDLQIEPGSAELAELLRNEDRVFAVYLFGTRREQRVPGPAALRDSERLGFNDVLPDGDTVRRGLLFLDDGHDEVGWSFALRLALAWLAQGGVHPAPAPENPEWLRLGPTTLAPFESDDGGYVDEDDAGYQMLVDFRYAARGFDTFHLGPLLRGEIDPARIRDRVVIIGVTAESLPDFFHVPIARGAALGKTPNGVESTGIHGVELHGHFTSQLIRFGLGESSPLRVLSGMQEALVILLAASLGCALARLGSAGVLVVALLVVGGVGLIFASGAIAFRAGVWLPIAGPGLAWLGSFGLVLAWSSSQERAQRATLMRLFSRHVSSEVADEIWRQRELFLGADGRPPSRRLVATILFVDMKGYTANAEKLDPESLMRWVNEFMEPMAELVVRHGGVVDDYFGDGMKANFGVPFARESEPEIAADAQRAVRCALEMGETLTRINASYQARGLPTVAMRIGLNTGAVVAGSLGSADRLKYTVVGDAVVVAQRLESLDGIEHDFDTTPCRVLISGETARRLDDAFRLEALGERALKGKDEPSPVYRVLGARAPAA